MTEAATSLPEKRRRLLWPLIFVGITVLGLILVKWAVPIAMEQRAIAAIRADCSHVGIQLPVPPAPPASPTTVPTVGALTLPAAISMVHTMRKSTNLDATYIGPEWIRERTGYELTRIESIRGSVEDLAPAAGHLRWLRNVVDVDLWGETGDEDTEFLRHFTKLETLNLRYCRFTDAGLSRLGDLVQLRRLSLKGSQIRGPGLAALSALDRVEELDLTHAPLADEGLRHISEMSGLKTLMLVESDVTDEGLVHLQKLPQLEKLCLLGANITDAGLPHLAPLPQLQDLDLSLTNVTLNGVKQLRACRHLKRLRLGGYDLSDAQLDGLEQTLPGCEVTRY